MASAPPTAFSLFCGFYEVVPALGTREDQTLILPIGTIQPFHGREASGLITLGEQEQSNS